MPSILQPIRPLLGREIALWSRHPPFSCLVLQTSHLGHFDIGVARDTEVSSQHGHGMIQINLLNVSALAERM
jgi:hypothetical protein